MYLEIKMISDDDSPVAESELDTAAALRLWVVMNRAQRAVGETVRRSVESHGLAPTEFAVLEVLYHKGPLLVGEVGSRILLTSGSTTYVIDKLEERGLVTRRSSPHDRRAISVELTEEGRERIGSIFPRHAEVIRLAMEGLTTEEKRIAAALLKRLGRFAEGR